MITVTFAGCGDAFGSGGRFQACIHLRPGAGQGPVLLDCGATSLTALRQAAGWTRARSARCSCPTCTGITTAGSRS